MNPFKLLCIEYEAIRGTISDYTKNPNIKNLLSQLKIGIENGDFETINYALFEITNWYDKNISEIATNSFTRSPESHKRNAELIKDILSRLKPEDCVVGSKPENDSSSSNEPLIFISHKSDDKAYGNALRDFISGLGVPKDQIIYTSHELHKIPLDENIFDYLRKNIHANMFMIILWSNKYLESPACLNEMGAAWVVQSDYTNIYAPDFAFGNPKYRECAVDTSKMGAVLNGDNHCRASMLELKDKIVKMFSLQVDEQTVLFLLDNFTNTVKALAGGKDDA